jgi:hypothetical protein
MIDREDILMQLDSGAESYEFPMLDNGYYYHGDQKLTIFRDTKRWAMLLEVLAYNNHDFGVDGITTVTYIIGNCLIGFDNNFHFFANDNGAETFIFEDDDPCPYLNSKAKSIKVRDIEIPIIDEREHYKSKNIELELDDKITPWEFMRGLIPEYSNLFWLTKEEISTKIPSDLPVLMTLANWHHPDLVSDEKPSETETFQQLADVILTGDKSLYNTSETNNTHWSNWLEGGKL